MGSATKNDCESLEGVADFLRPRLRLFLSVDLVGSTSFKQSASLPIREPRPDEELRTLGAQWFDPIAQFYGQIERLFADEWNAYREKVAPKCRWPIPPHAPELWKANGDELIYVFELSTHNDAYAAIVAWMRTVRAYRMILQKEHPNLDLKAGAWTAGFPLGNVEVVFRKRVQQLDKSDPENRYGFAQARLLHYLRLERWYKEKKEDREAADLVKDYIGPLMDLGFRLTSEATPRKFAITADLALILSHTSPPTNAKKKIEVEFFCPINIRYDGRLELKGVLSGKPYPFFWIDMLHDDQLLVSEDKLTALQTFGSPEIRNFCDNFFEVHQRYFLRPFLFESEFAELSEVPQAYTSHLYRLDTLWKLEKQRYEREEQALEEIESEGSTSEIQEDASESAEALLKREGHNG